MGSTQVHASTTASSRAVLSETTSPLRHLLGVLLCCCCCVGTAFVSTVFVGTAFASTAFASTAFASTAFVSTVFAAPDASGEAGGGAVASETIDLIASDAFGDVAQRAGWIRASDWVFAPSEDVGKVIPGSGVLLDREGNSGDLYTIAPLGDLELSGEFQLAPGSSATIGFLGRYDIRFTAPVGGEEAVAGDPGTIVGATPDQDIAPRLAVDCHERIWNRFSISVRAPRFDARGVRVEAARCIRVVLNGVVLQVAIDIDAPSAGASTHEVASAPLALRGGGGPVAYRQLLARPLTNRSVTPSNATQTSPPQSAPPLTRVVVFSRTAGFRHESIGVGIEVILQLGKRLGFAAVATEDPAQLVTWLDGTDVVVFMNTTGDILDDSQQSVFESYLRHGGGFLGVHAASDTEYDWPWYGEVMGAYFAGHPRVQEAVVEVVDQAHPATAMLPKSWRRRDEWYNYRSHPKAGIRILATLDTNSYEGSTMGEGHPICWCQSVEKGRAIYTGGGHTIESFREPLFIAHLYGALRWAAGDDRLDSAIPKELSEELSPTSNDRNGELKSPPTDAPPSDTEPSESKDSNHDESEHRHD